MTTAKKPTQDTEERSEAVAPSETKKVDIEELKKAAIAQYLEEVARLKKLKEDLEATGVFLEEPPTETTAVRPASEPVTLTPQRALRPKPGELIGGVIRPWTKEDLADQEKFPVVPQWIPGSVHPIPDANGKFHIFLDVNDLVCCLTVHELNVVSGMFYHAYRNIEDQWKKSEAFKKKGPLNAPWVNGGLGGINTWFYVGEAPNPWIDIDGGFYQPGSEMPMDAVPETRPAYVPAGHTA